VERRCAAGYPAPPCIAAKRRREIVADEDCALVSPKRVYQEDVSQMSVLGDAKTLCRLLSVQVLPREARADLVIRKAKERGRVLSRPLQSVSDVSDPVVSNEDASPATDLLRRATAHTCGGYCCRMPTR